MDIYTAIARAAHEANRAYCIAHGDTSQVSWDEAPEDIKDSARAGIKVALYGATPEQQHETWCDFKRVQGWVYGPQKDATLKTHPCLVPYADLPETQRAKGDLYIAVVRAMAQALGVAA